jgi:hypothetical protein
MILVPDRPVWIPVCPVFVPVCPVLMPAEQAFPNFEAIMERKKPGVDVIKDILEAAVAAYPASVFLNSLAKQYEERGGLSKKQLEGLYGKSRKIPGLAPAKLATLEAVILRKPTKYKSATPAPAPLEETDDTTPQKIAEILKAFPEHKRVLFFRNKTANKQQLSSTELGELEKFHKLLIRK